MILPLCDLCFNVNMYWNNALLKVFLDMPVRPHEALEGKTPAEACGIEIKGENKWMTLIQNASYQPKDNRTLMEILYTLRTQPPAKNLIHCLNKSSFCKS